MNTKTDDYDWLIKLIIIGNSGVGKTNVLMRFCQDIFSPAHLTTIDFKIKTLNIEGYKMRMQIWDTAGQQRFRTITQTYYKGALGIILVYSVQDRKSFQQIDDWMRQIKLHATQNVVKIILGNKNDSTQRKVEKEEGENMAKKYGVKFFQTSAKANINIQDAFNCIGTEIKSKVNLSEKAKKSQSSVVTKLKQGKKQKQTKKCC